jgi:transcriptional antiterminator RfaH
MSKEWFILQYKPNSHYRAARNLNQQGFETFLPLYSHTSRKVSKFVNVSRPLFPGYMFVKFDKSNNQWVKIRNTYGVSRLITFNSLLKSVPTNLINCLLDRCDISGVLKLEKKLQVGDKVEILNGPFANFIAVVVTLKADERAWMLLDLMGRQTKIETSLNNIQFTN